MVVAAARFEMSIATTQQQLYAERDTEKVGRLAGASSYRLFSTEPTGQERTISFERGQVEGTFRGAGDHRLGRRYLERDLEREA